MTKKHQRSGKKFLACGQNKENLLESFFQHWSTSAKNIIDNTRITVGHGGKCHIIKMNGTYTDLKVLKVKGLETIHEEADTRFMQHAAHAAKNNRHLVIKSPDTDVFVLALAFCSQINGHLYFHTIKTETHALFTPTTYTPILARKNEMPWTVCMSFLDVTLWVLCMGLGKQEHTKN